jgi:hypothetical protein
MDNVTVNQDTEEGDVTNVKLIIGETRESNVFLVLAVCLDLRVLNVTEQMDRVYVYPGFREKSVTNVLEDSLETLLTVLLVGNVSKIGMS